MSFIAFINFLSTSCLKSSRNQLATIDGLRTEPAPLLSISMIEEQKGQTWLRNAPSALFSSQSTKTIFCKKIGHGRMFLGLVGPHWGPTGFQCMVNRALLVETQGSGWGKIEQFPER